jgi:ribosomal protein L7/L12
MKTFSDTQVSDIQDLCLCILNIRGDSIKEKLKLELYNLVVEYKRNNDNTLTEKELLVGQTQSKLNCVKMVKERTGKALLESKLLVEKYFMDNGYRFYSPRPS